MDAAKERTSPTTIAIDGLQARDAGKLVRTKRSGGPRTAAGKLLSAKNALKTGTYSNQPVVQGESLKAYLELESYFIKEYNPQTITEGMMVSDLAKNVWKKLRLDRIETNNFISVLSKAISSREYMDVGFEYPRWVEGYLDEVENVETYDLAEKQWLYQITKQWLDDFPIRSEYDAELLKNPKFMELLTRQARAKGLDPATPGWLYDKVVRLEYYQQERMLRIVLREIHEEVGPLVWVLEHQNEILEANQRVRDERLRMAIRHLRLDRQMDDLNRRIFKLRDELCKAQDRRIALAGPTAKASPRRIRGKQNV